MKSPMLTKPGSESPVWDARQPHIFRTADITLVLADTGTTALLSRNTTLANAGVSSEQAHAGFRHGQLMQLLQQGAEVATQLPMTVTKSKFCDEVFGVVKKQHIAITADKQTVRLAPAGRTVLKPAKPVAAACGGLLAP